MLCLCEGMKVIKNSKHFINSYLYKGKGNIPVSTKAVYACTLQTVCACAGVAILIEAISRQFPMIAKAETTDLACHKEHLEAVKFLSDESDSFTIFTMMKKIKYHKLMRVLVRNASAHVDRLKEEKTILTLQHLFHFKATVQKVITAVVDELEATKEELAQMTTRLVAVERKAVSGEVPHHPEPEEALVEAPAISAIDAAALPASRTDRSVHTADAESESEKGTVAHAPAESKADEASGSGEDSSFVVDEAESSEATSDSDEDDSVEGKSRPFHMNHKHRFPSHHAACAVPVKHQTSTEKAESGSDKESEIESDATPANAKNPGKNRTQNQGAVSGNESEIESDAPAAKGKNQT